MFPPTRHLWTKFRPISLGRMLPTKKSPNCDHAQRPGRTSGSVSLTGPSSQSRLLPGVRRRICRYDRKHCAYLSLFNDPQCRGLGAAVWWLCVAASGDSTVAAPAAVVTSRRLSLDQRLHCRRVFFEDARMVVFGDKPLSSRCLVCAGIAASCQTVLCYFRRQERQTSPKRLTRC